MNTNEMTASGIIKRIGIEYAKMMKSEENTAAARIGIAGVPSRNDNIKELEAALNEYGMRIGCIGCRGDMKGEIVLKVYARTDLVNTHMLAEFHFDRDELLQIAA